MKKIKSSISRNLILSFVLLVTIILSILAWFATNEEATATGLTVRSKGGLGLEASFTGNDDSYSIELTESGEDKYEFTLVSSGNGTDFVVPALNLTSGKASPGTYKRTPIAGIDYFEKDIYFRASEELEIYLDPSSAIKPSFMIAEENSEDNVDMNLSNFGNFSRDYIAGAARAAFFNVTTEDNPETKDENEETLENKLLWIPNETYKLSSSDYFEELKKVSSGQLGLNSDPDKTFGIDKLPYVDDSDNAYLMWEGITENSGDKQNCFLSDKDILGNSRQNPQGRKMHYQNGKFYGAVDVIVSTSVDHAVMISKVDSEIENNNYEIPDTIPSQSSNFYVNQSNTIYDRKIVDFTLNGTKYEYIGACFTGDKGVNYPNYYKWSKLTIDSNNKKFFNDVNRYQLLISYNPDENVYIVEDFVFYNSDNPNIALGGTGNFGNSQQIYKFNENTKSVVITGTNTNGTYALGYDISENNFISTKITLNSDNKIDISSVPNNVFNVEKQSDTTAYLEHITSGKYLACVDGNLTLTDEKQLITLETGETGPMLKFTNGNYISLSDDNVFVANSNPYNLKIFKGTSFNFSTDGEIEDYKYYSKTSLQSEPLTNYVLTCNLGNVTEPLVTLKKKSDDSEYYYGHIKVRIWVEGEDREAKLPLVNGRFKNLLEFTGRKIVEETTESTTT